MTLCQKWDDMQMDRYKTNLAEALLHDVIPENAKVQADLYSVEVRIPGHAVEDRAFGFRMARALRAGKDAVPETTGAYYTGFFNEVVGSYVEGVYSFRQGFWIPRDYQETV